MDNLDSIRERLKRQRLSFVWLMYQLKNRGIKTDKTEISSIFAGTRKGEKVDSILQTATEILDNYEQVYVKQYYA